MVTLPSALDTRNGAQSCWTSRCWGSQRICYLTSSSLAAPLWADPGMCDALGVTAMTRLKIAARVAVWALEDTCSS